MPMNTALYPADWKAISRRIREREGQRCKWCSAPNGLFVVRNEDGSFQTWTHCERDDDARGTYWMAWQEDDEGGICSEYDHFRDEVTRPIRIVLTVAHLDHDTTHNADDNLAALCQRCHLRYDAAMHAQHAAETRRRKRVDAGQLELF